MEMLKVFISWSGERSKSFAEELRNWLPTVMAGTDPWVSSQDIDEPLWLLRLMKELRDARFGIICLTHDNLRKPWILFEAGALAKLLLVENGSESSNPEQPETYILPILIDDILPENLPGPLQHITTKSADKDGLRYLINQLNNAINKEFKLADPDDLFEEKWSVIELAITEIKASKSEEGHDLLMQLNIALEWKEAHNLLQLLDISFQPFYDLVSNNHTKNNRAYDNIVQRLWNACDAQLEGLVDFGKEIKCIGEPYREIDDTPIKGPRWLVTVMKIRKNIASSCSRATYDIDQLVEESGKFAFQSRRALEKADRELRNECERVYDLAGELK